MVQKTVLKIDLACQKCKAKVLKAVSIQGVDKIETDEAEGTLAVTGDADPVDIIFKVRKAISSIGKHAEVVSIGAPPKPDDKKPDDKKPDAKKSDPSICPYPYGYIYYYQPREQVIVVPPEPYPPCSIL